ncbi:hypothetical protein [Rhizobium herbae]
MRYRLLSGFVETKSNRSRFADGLDIGDLEIVLESIGSSIHEPARLRESLDSGEAFTWLGESEHLAHKVGVSATPTWLLRSEMIRGFVPEAAFEPFIPVDEKTEDGGHHSHGERPWITPTVQKPAFCGTGIFGQFLYIDPEDEP